MLVRLVRVVVTCCLVTAATGLAAPQGASGAGFINWPTYQSSSMHGSYNAAATAVTTANAGSIPQAWKWVPPGPTMPGQPSAQLFTSPTVYNGRIYMGDKTGVFFALDETTGSIIWQRFIGYQSGKTCNNLGFTSTATVAPDPTTGQLTVYVAAPTGEVVAFNASDGTVKWRMPVVSPSSQVNDYMLFASPTIDNGRIYIGTSSACDNPLVRAGVVSLRQTDGTILGSYYTQPSGQKGGSVWSSVAVDPSDHSVYVSTGNPLNVNQVGDSYSIVKLDGLTMQKTDIWTIPPADRTADADFGASPVLYTATINGQQTKMVSACDKNGYLYAWNRENLAAGPVWRTRIGDAGTDPNACIGGEAWDGTRLYQGGNSTTIGGTTYAGSVRALDPATGHIRWEVGLPYNVINTPTINGSGVLGIGTFTYPLSTANAAYFIEAATGRILRTFTTGVNGGVFSQMVFADNYVFLPSVSNGMRAFRAATTGNQPPTASFTPSCSQLTCSFDGTASTDPDGTVTAWNWTFGDGTSGTGATTSHTYAAAGSYQVKLTVTDDQGATGTTTSTVTVGQSTGIAFRDSASAAGNVTSVSLKVPSSVVAGDGMLLFASLNNGTSTVTTAPAGWQQVAEQLATSMRTIIWQRVATSSDPGSTVTIPLSAIAKVDVQLLAYSGTSATGPVSAFATAGTTTQTASHTTPAVNVVGTGSRVVSYWADKSSTTTAWTAPAGQTVRPHASYTTGSAYVTSLITDTGGPVAPGTYGGLTAKTDGAGGNKSTTATIVLGAA